MSRGHGVRAMVWLVALLLVAGVGPATALNPEDPPGDFSSQVVALVRDGSSVEVVTREVDSAREQQRVVDRLESDPDVQAIDVGSWPILTRRSSGRIRSSTSPSRVDTRTVRV